MPILARHHRSLFFAGGAALFLCLEWFVTTTAVFAHNRAVAYAVCADLLLFLPGAYFVFVLRPARRPSSELIPALALGSLAASLLLAQRSETRLIVRLALASSELALLAFVAGRVRAAAHSVRCSRADWLMRVHELDGPVLRVVGLELVMVYYALVGPFVRPRDDARGLATFTTCRPLRSLFIMLAVVSVPEGLGTHLLLRIWSETAAWIASGLLAYSCLWLLALYHAARLRPVIVTPERLLIRTSLLVTADVPIAAIASVTVCNGEKLEPAVLRAAIGARPRLLIALSQPVLARGLLGLARPTSKIALYVDDPDALLRALSSKLDANAR